jgi:hypothetical protein
MADLHNLSVGTNACTPKASQANHNPNEQFDHSFSLVRLEANFRKHNIKEN